MDVYIANAGQTGLLVQKNIHIPFLDFTKPQKPDPPLPPLILREDYALKGFVLSSQKQHHLPDVSAKMLDWFWANMEKGYYLWAPGSHKKFYWVKPPSQVGMEHSVHVIAESCMEGAAVFGGEGVEIHRLPLTDFFPFTTCLKHVICEGVQNDLGELADATIHMWEDAGDGIDHITATVTNTKCSEPPRFIKELLKENPNAKLVPNYATDHEDYEASQWPLFLPKLYALWKDHPDPSQNVYCCLTVQKNAAGQYEYIHENGPVTLREEAPV